MAVHEPERESLNKKLYSLAGIAVLLNFSGLFVPLMDPDAGIYASIAKNMVVRNDYINLWVHERDWLDKPHLPFWITAFFFKVFGLHGWVYKLPAVYVFIRQEILFQDYGLAGFVYSVNGHPFYYL